MIYDFQDLNYSDCQGIDLSEQELIEQALANDLEIDPQPIETIDLLPSIAIKKNILSLLVGKGGIGKTFIALQIAINFILQEQKRVLFYLFEDVKIVVSTRVKGLIHNLTTSQKALIYTHLKIVAVDSKDYMKKRLLLQAPIDTQSTSGTIKDDIRTTFEIFQLIIIDPLVTIAPVEIETNNIIASAFINNYHRIATQLQKNIIILHHSSKGSNSHDNKGGLVRGSSAIADQSRSILALTSALELPTITKHSMKYKSKEKSQIGDISSSTSQRLKEQAIHEVFQKEQIAFINELSILKNSYGGSNSSFSYVMQKDVIKTISNAIIDTMTNKIHTRYQELIKNHITGSPSQRTPPTQEPKNESLALIDPWKQ